MDRLAALLEQFSLQAEVFFTGTVCERAQFPSGDPRGHLHILKSGIITLHRPGRLPIEIRAPSVLYVNDLQGHELEPHTETEPSIVCSFLHTDGIAASPILKSLPGFWEVNFEVVPSLGPLINVLVYELGRARCGHKVALTKLVEYVFIVVLRHFLETGFVETGLIAALSDERLCRAILAVHERPEKTWTLESLAELAGMSRARFSVHFRDRVGQTPLDYVTHWRMMIVRKLLSDGLSVKSIAPKVGYRSAAALSRTFSKIYGNPPLTSKNLSSTTHF